MSKRDRAIDDLLSQVQPKVRERSSADLRIEQVLANEETNQDDIVSALLLWTLKRAHEDPQEVSVGQIANVLEASARLKAAGTDANGGMAEFMKMMEEEDEDD